MSKQYDSFMDELEQLMEKHNVTIYPSLYDNIEVCKSDSIFLNKEQKIKESLSNFVDKTQEINNAR